MYSFSGGRLKVADKKWNTTKSEYEITFSQSSEIVSLGNDNTIKKISLEFKQINEIENVDPGELVGTRREKGKKCERVSEREIELGRGRERW